jgi:hypothetical protein
MLKVEEISDYARLEPVILMGFSIGYRFDGGAKPPRIGRTAYHI